MFVSVNCKLYNTEANRTGVSPHYFVIIAIVKPYMGMLCSYFSTYLLIFDAIHMVVMVVVKIIFSP